MRWIIFIVSLFGLTLSTTQAQSTDTLPELDSLRTCSFSSDIPVSGLHMGAVLLNVETGRGCADKLDDTFPVASVPKLFILGAYLEEVALGWRSFNDPVTFTENYVMGGSRDCLSYDDVGVEFRYDTISELMISCSDNSATWMMMDEIGWDTVNEYVGRVGIDGVGPIIPYAEVDRLKLTLLDDRWANVPLDLASQFYRGRETDGLVPTYFDRVPNYSRGDRAWANQEYFRIYDYNTITPRAMAEYLLYMRDQLHSSDINDALAAWWFFDTMMTTQRQYTAQDLPGTVFVGAKNGWDLGLKAEVSVSFRSLTSNEPEGIAIVFAHQTDLSAPDVGLPNDENDLLNRYLASISPQVEFILYPVEEPRGEVSINSNIVTVTLARENNIETCRETSPGATRTAYLANLESCWRSLTNLAQINTGERLGLGIVLRGLANQDARFTMTFTAPDGQQYAYQYNTRYADADNVYWYHRLDRPGTWQIDIYQNLRRVYTDSIEAL